MNLCTLPGLTFAMFAPEKIPARPEERGAGVLKAGSRDFVGIMTPSCGLLQDVAGQWRRVKEENSKRGSGFDD